ncbi:MAG: response regulator [Deltaproteobacteria bacterium]|nr:response regulator [Deltaproteobacteria bacterium]
MKATLDLSSLSGKAVLLVDDEEIVTDVIREVLSPAVELLETATNGEEALAKIMEMDFDFILLDIEMPKMNGMELYRYVKEIKPHLLERIIFITGDTETALTRTFIMKSECRYLDKPFMLRDLFRVMISLP